MKRHAITKIEFSMSALIFIVILVHNQFSLQMAAKPKFSNVLERRKFNAQEDSFFATIWWYSKGSQVFGQTAVKISSTKTKAKESKHLTAYFLVVSTLSAVFIIYSHLNMKHDHHNHKNPMIMRVAYSQIIVVTLTAAIGAINSFVQRQNFIKVKKS